MAACRWLYEEKRALFQKENRAHRKRFSKRTEEKISKGGNNFVAEAIRTDKRHTKGTETEGTSS